LFYESHQAQWVAGRRPLADLLREPQARHAPGLPSPTAASAPLATPVDLPAGKSAADSLGSPVRSTPADPLPPELQPLVQQQLDAAAHQPILWRGEVWPGQTMNWEIREEKERRDTSEEVAAQWQTRVRLVLPQLGELAADLSLTPAGVSIRLAAAEGRSSDALRNSLADLSAALGAAGVPLVAMKVDNGY
jgi:hypothetical protein